jgi:trigger factor
MTHKETQLLVRVEELEGWKRKLVISLAEADVEAKSRELLAELAKDATAPGFRKGKVPPGMIEKSHGGATRAEALRMLAGSAYADAVRESGIHPICDPVVELEGKPEDGQYTLTATVEVKPEFELSEYQDLEFTERVPVVSNEDVENYIEKLREERAELLQVTRPAATGDIVVMDYEAIDDQGNSIENSKTEDYICELGRDMVPPEIEKELIGASPGDAKTATVHYPDDFRVEELAGKDVTFSVTLKDVRQKRLPVVDDDFAKACGPFETLLDLRVRVRNALEGRAKAWARNRLEESIVREIIERNPFTLPECLVEDRLKRTFWRTRKDEGAAVGQDTGAARKTGEASTEPPSDLEVPEDFAELYRPVIEHQLKAGLILAKIAEKHGTEVTKEDIEKRVHEIAESQGRKPDEMMNDLAGTDVLSQIEDDLWLEKVHDFLVGVSKVTTEQFTPGETEKAGETPDAAGPAGV